MCLLVQRDLGLIIKGSHGVSKVDYPMLDYMYAPSRLQPMEAIERRTICPQSLCTVVRLDLRGPNRLKTSKIHVLEAF